MIERNAIFALLRKLFGEKIIVRECNIDRSFSFLVLFHFRNIIIRIWNDKRASWRPFNDICIPLCPYADFENKAQQQEAVIPKKSCIESDLLAQFK